MTELDPLELLTGAYAFRSPNRVTSFLQSAAFLIPLLREIPQQVHEVFGSDCPLVLDALPEENEMVVRIQTSLEPEEALDRLRAFDDAWWLDALPRAQQKLTVTVEFA